ncbi:hypothetical protein EDF31_10262 [Curtobacterium sp. PhB142]|nr:hypothetical protein EDF31_10262 [Curtobacterium sp. PhB142]TCM05287.1 hypothetical protein EDF26_101517 [Curtobacterium sp. PhB134]
MEYVVGFAGVLVAALAVGGLAGWLRLRRSVSSERGAAVVVAQRALLVRVVLSLVVGLAVFVVCAVAGTNARALQGVSFFVGPSAGAGVALLVFAAIPAVAIDGATAHRSASLQVRSARSALLPQQWRRLWWAVGCAVGIVLVAGLGSAPAPDGRWLCTSVFPMQCPAGDGPYLFPGWYFGLPALLGIALLSAGVWASLWRIAVTPAAAWPDLDAADGALRQRAGQVVALVGTAAALLTAAVFLSAAGLPLMNALHLDSGLAGGAATVVVRLGMVVVLAGVVVAFAGIVTAVAAVVRAVTAARLIATGAVAA